MKTCPTCNRVYSDMVTVCPACHTNLSSGVTPVPQPKPVSQPQPVPQPEPNPQPEPDDKLSFGYILLSFFLPIVGIILWKSMKKSQPAAAKTALICAILGIILGGILSADFV